MVHRLLTAPGVAPALKRFPLVATQWPLVSKFRCGLSIQGLGRRVISNNMDSGRDESPCYTPRVDPIWWPESHEGSISIQYLREHDISTYVPYTLMYTQMLGFSAIRALSGPPVSTVDSGVCRGQVLEKVHDELRTAELITAAASANALAAAACLEQLDAPQVIIYPPFEYHYHPLAS